MNERIISTIFDKHSIPLAVATILATTTSIVLVQNAWCYFIYFQNAIRFVLFLRHLALLKRKKKQQNLNIKKKKVFVNYRLKLPISIQQFQKFVLCF